MYTYTYVRITHALPLPPMHGRERQDSVFNGFSQTKPEASVVCIHDSARPLVSQQAVLEVSVCVLGFNH